MKTIQILNLYIKILALTVGLMIGMFVLVTGTRAALAANLKNVSVISGELLTVGDLFDGLSAENAAYVLGPAPQPGQEMILNARTLMQIAATLNLTWQPRSAADQIVVRRAATVIPEETIKSALSAEIRKNGIDGSFDISFSGGFPEMVLPQDKPATFEISNFHLNPQSDWFEAKLSAPSAEKALIEVSVAGKVRRLVQVPVLKNTLRQGDVISAHDINWLDLYSDELQHDILLTESDIIGMTPRRFVEAGKPLRDIQLEQPRVVGRGEMVTLIYKDGPIVLTVKGKALQHGAKGDFIRVVNASSNQTLEGIVSGTREVIVQ